MTDVDFRILGPLEVVRGGDRLPLGGAKQRTVLALLLVNANRVVATDMLVEALWPEAAPGKPLTAVQGYVSQLRKTLGADAISTEPAGYRLRLTGSALDLHRFEVLLASGRESLAEGDPHRAREELTAALSLFQGAPLADFTYADWARLEIGRLGELRLACLEERIDADLAIGRHSEIVGELDALIAHHPLRERLRGQLMLALYRSGRQSEALAAYQAARETLVDEFGIDPSPALRDLEKSILRQDEGLGAGAVVMPGHGDEPSAQAPERSILVVAGDDDAAALVALAEPLARSLVPHELIVARLISPENAATLGDVSGRLQRIRESLVERHVRARTAVFTSSAAADDLLRLATDQDVDLFLLERTGEQLAASTFDDELRAVLADAPCDVAVAVRRVGALAPSGDPVLVPFGGSEHDWAALELAAWLASANARPLRLLGSAGDHDAGTRDASRLLATAALAVQQLVAVATEPVLLPGREAGLVEATRDAAAVVTAFPSAWRERGLGSVRAELARAATAPTLFVRRGVRPGGLAPNAGQTRFTWSIAEGSGAA